MSTSTSAGTGTRIFGLKVTLDPKIIIGALLLFAGILYWYNSGSDDTATAPASAALNLNPAVPVSAPAVRSNLSQRRAAGAVNDRGTLRLRPVDATRGDVDPTLRLDLLRRLANIQTSLASRSLFEAGALAPAGNLAKIHAPIILPKQGPLTAGPTGPIPVPLTLTVNIPLKYYGFVRPSTPNSANSGLFLDGDNVMVAREGEVVKQRYLVVELTANSARLEDTQLKQGQTLPVVPVAAP